MRNVWLGLAAIAAALVPGVATAQDVQVGPRPYFLIDKLPAGALKDKLQSCAAGPFKRTGFSIGHRGAPLQFPEHTEESYRAAARMGAGVLECDVAFTKDRQLVCRHAQCDLHTTTNILAIPEIAAKCRRAFTPADPARGIRADAQCCTSDLTLAEFTRLTGEMDAFDGNATTPEATCAARQAGARTSMRLRAAGGYPRREHRAVPGARRQVHARAEGARGADAVRRRLHASRLRPEAHRRVHGGRDRPEGRVPPELQPRRRPPLDRQHAHLRPPGAVPR